MNNIRIAMLAFLLFFVMMFVLGCTSNEAGDVEELVVILSQELDIIEHGRNESSLTQLRETAELLSGDSIYVHEGGSGHLNFGDKMLIRLFNDTKLNEIRAESVEGVPLDVQMFLAEGGLTGRLADVGGRTTITTPNDAKIEILGTEFFVIFDPANDIAAAGNFGGTVEISKAGQTRSLESGSFVILAGRNPPSDPRPIGASLEEFEQRSIELSSPLGAYDELSCVDDLTIVGDLSIPRGTVIPPGETFVKSWEVRNTGSCSWNQNYTLQFIGGSEMSGATPIFMDTIVNPDVNKSFSVTMVAPMVAGTYSGMWQLIGPQSEAVGRPLEVEIVVPEVPSVPMPSHTPLPTAIPIPTIVPSHTPVILPTFTPIFWPSTPVTIIPTHTSTFVPSPTQTPLPPTPLTTTPVPSTSTPLPPTPIP